MAYLEIRKDKALLQSTLDDEAMSLGRLPGNSVVFIDPDISRRHCVIEQWEGKYSIYDLGSRNGTKINGKRVQRAELKHGDVITVGSTLIKFVEGASMGGPARRLPLHRSVAWGVAIIVLLIGAFLGSWATGLLGRAFEPRELHNRLGTSDQASGNAANRSTNAREDEQSDPTSIPARDRDKVNGSRPLPRSGDIEMRPWSDHYEPIAPETVASQRDKLVGRAVSARFVGKPLLDEHGEVLWELPPDGSITAMLQPSDAEAQRLLTVLMAEPLLVDVELAGLLDDDLSRGRMVLKVGVIEILHAWGGKDESLQPATRRMLSQRLVLNPRYTSQAIESRASD